MYQELQAKHRQQSISLELKQDDRVVEALCDLWRVGVGVSVFIYFYLFIFYFICMVTPLLAAIISLYILNNDNKKLSIYLSFCVHIHTIILSIK